MRLLIVTQSIDQQDPYLGFFHRWLEEFSEKFERIEAICLREGKHALPANVQVHSLGKEQGRQSSVVYAFRFLMLTWRLRHEYDAVLVHMNQEYVLISGWLWKVLGKNIYLWRNHYAGSLLTNIAGAFCRTVFYTSKHSYTAQFKNAIAMPVGVDTKRFYTATDHPRTPRSILMFGRMTESKRLGLVVDALITLAKRDVDFTASFIGSVQPGEEGYVVALQQRIADAGIMDRIVFKPGVPHDVAPRIFQEHQIYVNAGRSGMFDKTLFEAAASGCVVLASSDDWRNLVGEETYFDSSETLAIALEAVLNGHVVVDLVHVVQEHALPVLAERLKKVIV